jgi:hypothetical protein
MNAFSKPDPRGEELGGFAIPLELVGAGGNAAELAEDTLGVGREALGSALLKSKWSSNALSKVKVFSAGAGAVLGKSPNAWSKSLIAATFGGSGDAANGEVEAGGGLPSFTGGLGKGLVLWTSAEVAADVVTGGDVASVVS